MKHSASFKEIHYPAASIQNPVSGIRYPESSIKHQVFPLKRDLRSAPTGIRN